MSARKRTHAREIAVQLLYQHDIRSRFEEVPDIDAEGIIAAETEEPEVRDFAVQLYTGAVESIASSDRLIADVADNWTLERIAVMDRAILRLAVYELNELPEVPPKVVVNEAIEIAKKFSTERSGSFVNGILDRLLPLRKLGTKRDDDAL